MFHLQWVSLKLTKFFTQHNRHVPLVPAPDPNEIVECIQEQRQWEPNLTPAFTDRYNLRAFLQLHSRQGQLAGSVRTAMTTATTATPSGAASVMSGITAPTAAVTIATGGGNTTGVRVDNTHFNSTLFGTYKTSSIKSKTLRQKIERNELPPLPASKLNQSKPMCLAWHTKAQCNTNCPCILDHVAYTEGELAPLAAWCRDHGYCSE